MSAAVLAFGAASALGLGRAAFDVGQVGERPKNAWATRDAGKPFARVQALEAPRAARPRALLELALRQLVEELDREHPRWRGLRLGVAIGTSSGGFAALENALTLQADDLLSAGAYFSPLAAIDDVLEQAPQRLVSVYAACASSALALGLGLRWLELGEVDLVLAGGYDAESDWVCAGFDALKATCAAVPRPFREERDGMALGEGVALLALGREGAKAFGFLRGFAATTDAVHITAPDRTGEGLARAARLALADAQLAPRDVSFVSAHGTGTSFNDAAESAALGLVFASQGPALCLHAFKSIVGHTLGAAGALEALSALSALKRGVSPASASVGTPMPGLPARLLEVNEASDGRHCLKLSTAFGGANAALVLSGSDVERAPRPRLPVHLSAVGVRVTELELERVVPLLVAPPERLPRSDTLSELCVAAGAELLRAAARQGVSLDRLRTGVVVGTATASLQANADFGTRIRARGREHAEPRRFPATSPNVCAGHVAIAFGLGGPSHAVGAGANAAFEAVQVARDWLAAGDADAMLVLTAENGGDVAREVLRAAGISPPSSSAQGVLLTRSAHGPALAEIPEIDDFQSLLRWGAAAGLPGPKAFGSVRPPE